MTIYRDPKPVKCPRCLGSGVALIHANVNYMKDLDGCSVCYGSGMVKQEIIYHSNWSLEDIIKDICIRSGMQEDEIDLSYFEGYDGPQPKEIKKDEIKPDLMRKKIRDWT